MTIFVVKYIISKYKSFAKCKEKKMNKVLVTGAYGFLGKYVIRELISSGYIVIAFGRKNEELKKLKKEFPDITVFKGDFTDPGSVAAAVRNVDYVIHTGALSTVWGNKKDFIKTNVGGTKNVIKACNAYGVKKLVYVSSPSIYCCAHDREMIEEWDYDPNNRLSYYIESKIRSEKLFEHCRVPYTIIRPRGLIGLGDVSIIPRLIKANRTIGVPLFNGGFNKVDMTCVENVALALRLCLEHPESDGKCYNITNGEPREFKEILEKLFKEIGEKPKYLKAPLGVMIKLAGGIETVYRNLGILKEPPITKYTIYTLGFSQTMNIEPAKRDLGYCPKITLDEGIENYAKTYGKN